MLVHYWSLEHCYGYSQVTIRVVYTWYVNTVLGQLVYIASASRLIYRSSLIHHGTRNRKDSMVSILYCEESVSDRIIINMLNSIVTTTESHVFFMVSSFRQIKFWMPNSCPRSLRNCQEIKMVYWCTDTSSNIMFGTRFDGVWIIL